MIILPPETKMEWAVYKDLKANDYWKQTVEKKIQNSNEIEVQPKFSEGEKAIIYDTFRMIDQMFTIDYSKVDLHYYLVIIDFECNHKNTAWIAAIKNIMKKAFNIDTDKAIPEKI